MDACPRLCLGMATRRLHPPPAQVAPLVLPRSHPYVRYVRPCAHPPLTRTRPLTPQFTPAPPPPPPPPSDTPTIMDYIKLKHEVTELEKQLVDWRRKIDILTMEKTRKRTLLKSVASTTQVGRQAAGGARAGWGGVSLPRSQQLLHSHTKPRT